MATKYRRYSLKDDQTILLSIEGSGDIAKGCKKAAIRLDRTYASIRARYNMYLWNQKSTEIEQKKTSTKLSSSLRGVSQVVVEDGTMEIENGKAVLTGKFTLLL